MNSTCARGLSLAFLLLASTSALCDGGARYPVENVQIWAAGVPVRVIRVSLDDPHVRVSAQVARGCPSSAESFDSMVSRSNPEVAINGAYFSKESLKPIGDIVVDGKLVTAGLMGTALAITPDNRAIIRRVKKDHGEDWSGYQTVIGCGPALVLNGEIDLDLAAEGFHDPHIMGSVKRMGVGLVDDRHLILVTTLEGVDFPKWAKVMKALGCKDAMNLDAGASLAMYFRGKTLIPAGRKLTNLLTVHVAAEQAASEPPPAAKPLEPLAKPLESAPTPADRTLGFVNDRRKDAGAAPLRSDSRLNKAAQDYAAQLARLQRLSHTDEKGKEAWDRIRAAGYTYRVCGENLASFSTSAEPDYIVQMWMESTGHRRNMLNPEFVEAGIGVAASEDGGTYWVLVLAQPARSPAGTR